jgi:hypothetical protein
MPEANPILNPSNRDVPSPDFAPGASVRPKLPARTTEALCFRHYSRRVEHNYSDWIKQFSHFRNMRRIRTVQELVGHRDRKARMIYAYVLNRDRLALGARSMDWKMEQEGFC